MSRWNPAAILYNAAKKALAVVTGQAVASDQPGLVVAGSDGTNARFLKTDAAGRPDVSVASSALPSGASTEATLAARASESTLEAARVILEAIRDTSGIKKITDTVNVLGPLTNTELRAAPVDVDIEALTVFSTNQANVTTTASQLAGSPLASRKTVSIKALASNAEPVYLGASNAVTSGNGYELSPGDSVDVELGPGANLWAIAALGTQRVCWMEIA
jgi:hypothetical protein